VKTLALIFSLICASAQAQFAFDSAPFMAITGAKPSGGTPPVVVNAWKGAVPGALVNVAVSPTAGNCLIAAISGQSGATVSPYTNCSISANVGSGWIKATNSSIPTGTDNKIMTWYYPNIPSGITNIAFNFTNGLYMVAIVHEVSGLSQTAPVTSGEVLQQTTASTVNPQTSNLSYATANSILFAFCGNNGNGALALNGTGTTGGTWAYYSANSHNDSSSYEIFSVPYVIESSSGSAVHGWTVSPTIANTTIIMALHP
jgi:hypothetical protein